MRKRRKRRRKCKRKRRKRKRRRRRKRRIRKRRRKWRPVAFRRIRAESIMKTSNHSSNDRSCLNMSRHQ